MQKDRFHPLIAWLFLIWFGLINAAFVGGLVVCDDGHGGSRIEWGCDRNATGACVTSCGSEGTDEEGDASHPCEDTPISSDQQVTKILPRSVTEVCIPVPMLVAVLVLWGDSTQPTMFVSTGSEPQRPPDALKCIRTVVLLE